MENLPILIDYQNKTALSEQIADQLRRIIHSGMIKPGDPLPTVRQLAFQLRVNFNTIARAYRILDAERIIVTWQGRGTFVEHLQSHDLKEIPGHHEAASQLIERLFEEASAMRIPEETIWKILLKKQPSKVAKIRVRHRFNARRRKALDKKIFSEHSRSKGTSSQTTKPTTRRQNRYRNRIKSVSRETLVDL